ncbi:MAG: hypothetical protein FWC44_00445 [Methanomassiliicoccaceae archaeon]|nr:hypothetical protein [Methanomassiliicoccaceae archaeon]
MTKAFEEVQDLIPRNAFLIMTFALAATAAFMFVCSFIEEIGTPIWMSAATAVIFAGMIIFCFVVKLRVIIEDNVVSIRLLKRYDIKFEEIIDFKTGDISIIRNYSGWGIKKVAFKNLVCVGYDNGISLKVTGRRVFTISLTDPEAFASLLPAPSPPQS